MCVRGVATIPEDLTEVQHQFGSAVITREVFQGRDGEYRSFEHCTSSMYSRSIFGSRILKLVEQNGADTIGDGDGPR